MSGSWAGAPVTKLLAASTFLGAFLGAWAPRALAALKLGAPRQVFERGEAWRVVTSMLFCDSLVAAGVSSFLLFRFRVFERQMGSSKFAAFVAMAAAAAAAARVGLVAIPALGAAGLASGPLHVVFGLVPLFFCAGLRREGERAA